MRILNLLCFTLIIFISFSEVTTGYPESVNIHEITNVPVFRMNYNGAAMPIAAIKTVLDYHKIKMSHPILMAVSGKAFAFTYDNSNIREPQRDLSPVDYFNNIVNCTGISGKWVTGNDIDSLEKIIIENMTINHPVIATCLVPDGYKGYYIITGYNPEKKELHVRDAQLTREELPPYSIVPLQKKWDGPVTNQMKWAQNPVFLLSVPTDRKPVRGKEWILKTLEQACTILQITNIPYVNLPDGTNPGKVYAANRSAPHSTAAYDALKKDISGLKSSIKFNLIWRLDAQLSQLGDARKNASRFFDEISLLLPANTLELCRLLTGEYKIISDHARFLQKLFWFHITSMDKDKIIQEIRQNKAIVYSFETNPENHKKIVQSVKGKLIQTDWGACITLLTPELKQKALDTVTTMKHLESENVKKINNLITLLEQSDR